MLQLSKKVEYGLIALRHMALSPRGHVFTAKEIAVKHNIPYELLAKILQKLTRGGIVTSTQGMRGGYSLAMKPDKIRVLDVIKIIDEDKLAIVECCSKHGEKCSIVDGCTIRRPLEKIQNNLNSLFENITLEQIV